METAGFNKLRMCVFPKDYIFNKNEPVYDLFAKKADGSWDFTRYDVAFFRHLEQRVAQLGALGIEADIILFHPYDRWGYAKMAHEQDYAYLRYVVARLAALRNVWWSMANEYDFMLRDKPMEVSGTASSRSCRKTTPTAIYARSTTAVLTKTTTTPSLG